MSSKKLIRNIGKIKQEIFELGHLRPGSITKQYNVCGKTNCKCKDKDNPKKHGPYYQLSYTFQGKSYTQFIPEVKFKETQAQIKNYKKFKILSAQLIENYLQLFKLQK